MSLKLYEGLQKVLLIEGVLGCVGNLIVCATILKTKALRNTSNLMILNLAIADTMVSLMSIFEPTVLHYYNQLGIRSGKFGQCNPIFIYCFMAYFVLSYFQKVSFGNSVYSLTLATFEHYIGIIKPLHYSTFFTKKRLSIMLLVVWITPYLIELHNPIFFISNFKKDNCTLPTRAKYPSAITSGIMRLIFTFITPSIALAFMYIRILINLKQGAKNLETRGIQGPALELLRAQKKVTKSLVLVIAAFFILILPGQIFRNMLVFNNLFAGNYLTAELFTQAISVMTSMNSAINPILYGFKYGQLRRACIAMLCPWDNCKRSSRVAHE